MYDIKRKLIISCDCAFYITLIRMIICDFHVLSSKRQREFEITSDLDLMWIPITEWSRNILLWSYVWCLFLGMLITSILNLYYNKWQRPLRQMCHVLSIMAKMPNEMPKCCLLFLVEPGSLTSDPLPVWSELLHLAC